MKEYLYQQWIKCNAPKYWNLFDEWFGNLTPAQIMYFDAFSQGKKTIH